MGQTKRQPLLRIAHLHVDLHGAPSNIDQLRLLAYEHYKFIKPIAAEMHIDRMCVNYLRHYMSRYDSCIAPYNERSERLGRYARGVVFCKVTLKIMKHYPELRRECYKQLQHRYLMPEYRSVLKRMDFDPSLIDGERVLCPFDHPLWFS